MEARARARASIGLVVLATATAMAMGGCTYRSYSQPATGYVEVTSAPVSTAYPYTYYEGRPVYLVEDRWMYSDRGRWVYYREEPPYLYRQRVHIQQAPRAYPGYAPYRGQPGTGPATPPPAVRVQ